MIGEKDDGVLSGNAPTWLVFVALLSGAGSGVVGLTKDTSDRYKGADAAKDFQSRDIRINYAIEEIRDLKRQVQKIDDTHPPPDLIARITQLEREVHELQLSYAQLDSKHRKAHEHGK